MCARFLFADLITIQGTSAVPEEQNKASLDFVWHPDLLTKEAISIGFRLLQGFNYSYLEALALLIPNDCETMLLESDADVNQHAPNLRAMAHEFLIFHRLRRDPSPFDAGTAAPGIIEKDDLAHVCQ